MSLYRLARPLLFSLDEETSHHLALRTAGLAALVAPRVPRGPVRALGLEFPNPIGLAAGLDKNAAHIDALGALGFGFLEVGTVTPRAQPGNPRPRLFRLPARQAIINRFGFNNVGLGAFIDNVRRARWNGVLGINIGKNADTPAERAIDDYELGLKMVYPHAAYVTINISSPNTKGLRTLQEAEHLEALLKRLSALREPLAERYGRRVPLVVKVAPDLSLPGHPEVFAIGDLAAVVQPNGAPVPGLAPAAMQMARHVAGIMKEELDLGSALSLRPAFRYRDKGTLATIGRSAGVALFGKVKLHGFIAWLAWLVVHLIFLIGFRNKIAVLVSWTYSYFTYKLGARIITGSPESVTPLGSGAQSQATKKVPENNKSGDE